MPTKALSCQIPCRKCPSSTKKISKLPSKVFYHREFQDFATLWIQVFINLPWHSSEQWVGWFYFFIWINSTHLCKNSSGIFHQTNFEAPIQESNQCFVWNVLNKRVVLFPTQKHGTIIMMEDTVVDPAGCLIHLPAATGHCRATSLRISESKIGSLEANFQR